MNIGHKFNKSTIIGGASIIGAGHMFKGTPAAMSSKENKSSELVGINYIADNSGCAFYRILWPTMCMNSRGSYISDMRRMVLNFDFFYSGVQTVRAQRQVSNEQFEMYKELRAVCSKENVKLIYEIDDVPLIEDIPLYNSNRNAYIPFRDNIVNMMNMSDEITVTCPFMRDYFKSKISNKNITVIPNYIPKFWMGNFYNEDKLKVNYSKNKNRPRILYAGSGSHYSNDPKIEDDFTAIVPLVEKTYKDFKWVFFGGLPRPLLQLLHKGHIEWFKWTDIINYPNKFDSIDANLCVAPLLKNNFNRSKSDIKLIESGLYGLPCICQDNMETYRNAIHKFSTPAELHDKIKYILKDSSIYMKECRKSYMLSKKYWLEDNISAWEELYKYPCGSEKRVTINAIDNRGY